MKHLTFAVTSMRRNQVIDLIIIYRFLFPHLLNKTGTKRHFVYFVYINFIFFEHFCSIFMLVDKWININVHCTRHTYIYRYPFKCLSF